MSITNIITSAEKRLTSKSIYKLNNNENKAINKKIEKELQSQTNQEMINFYKQVNKDKKLNSNLSIKNKTKTSIVLTSIVPQATSIENTENPYNTCVFTTEINRNPKFSKSKFLFRRAFLLIRVMNSLKSGKSISEKFEVFFLKIGFIKDEGNSLRNRISKYNKQIEDGSSDRFEKIVEHYLINKINLIKPRKDYVLYSDMKIRKFWDALMILILSYISIYYPYKIAFLNDNVFHFDVLFYLDLFIDICFLIDFIFSFFTPFFKNGKLEDEYKSIAVNYLKSWFVIDLISILPSFAIELISQVTSKGNATKTIINLLKFLRIFKVSKIFKSNPFFDRFILFLRLDLVVKSIIKYIIFLFLFLHFLACVFYMISSDGTSNEVSWIKSLNDIDELSHFDIYINSLYFNIVTSFTVGYGDITVKNFYEIMYLILYLLIGLGIYSFCVSNLTSLFELISNRDNFYREKEDSVKEFCRNHSLSIELYHEIKNFLIDDDSKTSNFYSIDKDTTDIKELTGSLPLEMYKEIYLDVFMMKLRTIPIFNQKTEKFLILLISLIDIKCYNFNSVLYKPGDIAKEVYILWKGRVTLINSIGIKSYEEYLNKKSPCFEIRKDYSNQSNQSNEEDDFHYHRFFSVERKKEMTYFHEGDLFGEEDILKKDGMTRKFTVKVNDYSVLICLKKREVEYLSLLDVEFKKKIEKEREMKENVYKFIFDVKVNEERKERKEKKEKTDNINEAINVNLNLNEEYSDFIQKQKDIISKVEKGLDYQSISSLFSIEHVKKIRKFIYKIKKKHVGSRSKSHERLTYSYNELNRCRWLKDNRNSFNDSNIDFSYSNQYSNSGINVSNSQENSNFTKSSFSNQSLSSKTSHSNNSHQSIPSLSYISERHLMKRPNSSSKTTVKYSLFNYSHQENYEFKSKISFETELKTLLSKRKFFVINSEIFPLIYKVNQLLKKVFLLKRSVTYQFEEFRKMLSNHSVDEFNLVNSKISESFSLFFEVVEDLNLIYSKYSFGKIESFIRRYNEFSGNVLKRVELIEEGLGMNT